jgi:uncharacterized membrane protein YhaH (DUF805 family)
MNWYLAALKKYAVFSGRARRKEYWLFALSSIIFGVIVGLIGTCLGGQKTGDQLIDLYGLAILIPSLAVSVRRLHDTNKSGWWLLPLMLCPVILLIFMFFDSQPDANPYGPNPKRQEKNPC